ncbi:MAG TPA: dimethylsulfonioproprionate lyase family protein [Albidovulum sp.]|uniref:dimethylsulfonioproprionate lyase family protein n=1 Tax=Albidovulum sp. TaxID=1872424 RepID=UPI002CD47208|nr:dimethylsulfonioproprionate lyase family protein [Albidovulum sp.]
MSDALRLIHTPLGQRGSGRVRYGAAMALHGSGGLSEAALEVYRICSPLDAQDPVPMLMERGLTPPPPAPPPGTAALRHLLDEADSYLAGLPGEGPAEVRLGLARGGPATNPPSPTAHPLVEEHLGDALALLERTHPALALAIAAATPHLTWTTYDEYAPDLIGDSFPRSHAFASLVGGEAPFHAADFDFGLFLIAPHLLYRDRRHKAPELYAPLTGPHGWRFAPGAPLVIKAAHEPVWNDANQPHLTKVGPNPLLCFFGWTADVNEPAEIVPAPDWAALEALRL